MGNVTLPTPVALAGGVICILGGFLLGAVIGPDTAARTTATVTSYDRASGRLCLEGDGVKDQPGTDEDGTLCGSWRRADGARVPAEGDSFRFVTLRSSGGGGQAATVFIYGDVVR